MSDFSDFSALQWKERSSMRPVGAADNHMALAALAGGQILDGNMDYRGESGAGGFDMLREDFQRNDVDFSLLDYGYVEQIEISYCSAPQTMPPSAAKAWRLLNGRQGDTTLDKPDLSETGKQFCRIRLTADSGENATMYISNSIEYRDDLVRYKEALDFLKKLPVGGNVKVEAQVFMLDSVLVKCI